MAELVPFAIAFVAVVGITPLIRRWALATNFVDRPSARRFHEDVTPLGGGLAIALGIVGTLIVSGVFGAPVTWWAPFFVGLVGITALGAVDDRRGLSPAVKLLAQGAAAICLVLASGVDSSSVLGVFAIPLAIIWVVGLLNACNFLDNMDGILAGIAALCALGFWGLGAGREGPEVVVLAAATAGGSFGFLIYNFAPARIFMGDAGSMALGYVLAALSLEMVPDGRSDVGWPGLVAVLLVVSYPVFDITFVTIMRLLERRKVYLGGRDHSTHRLNNALDSPGRTAITIYALTGVIAALGVLVGRDPTAMRAAVLGGAAVVFLVILGLRIARLPAR